VSAIVRANLLRRWGRTLLTGLGVALGVTTTVALLALTGGLSRSAGDLAKLGHADLGVFQRGVGDLTVSSLPLEVVGRVARVPGIAATAPIQVVAHAIAGHSSTLLFGARLDSFLARRLVLTSGAFAHGDEVMVGSAAADALHVRAGGRLSVLGHKLRVAAVYRSGITLEDEGVVLSLPVSQRLSKRPGQISTIAALLAPGYPERAVELAVDHTIPGTVALGDPAEVSRVDTNSRLLTKAAVIIAVLSLLLGAVVVVNTMAMAMIERRTEFGVLAAVGWTRGRIARLILGETAAIGLGGALVGLGLGALASELLVQALTASTFVTPAITPWVLGRGLLVGVALAVLGALFALWQILRTPTLRALQR
jgi:putative ABC transport system permease protein